MDTSKLDNFVDMIDTTHSKPNVLWLIKHVGSNEYRKDIRQKEMAFEKGVIEFYLEYGDNTDRVLRIYYDKLILGYKTLYKARKRLPLIYLATESERQQSYFYTLLIDNSLKAIKYISKILNIDYRQDLQDKKKIAIFANDDDLQNIKYEPLNTNSVHYTTNLSDKKLKIVYEYLIENEHLEKDTLLSDFIYFFTGRGKKVNNGLRWSSKKGEKVNLAFFLQAIIGDDPKAKVWKKAEDIFGKKGLAQSYSEAPETSLHARKISRDVQRLVK